VVLGLIALILSTDRARRTTQLFGDHIERNLAFVVHHIDLMTLFWAKCPEGNPLGGLLELHRGTWSCGKRQDTSMSPSAADSQLLHFKIDSASPNTQIGHCVLTSGQAFLEIQPNLHVQSATAQVDELIPLPNARYPQML
jgi:hypothetical protein